MAQLSRVIHGASSLTRVPAVILIGSDPARGYGGIAAAIAGYRDALAAEGALAALVPTYRARAFAGRWWFAAAAVPRILGAIRRARNTRRQPILYAHCGDLPSLVRKVPLILVARDAGARTILHLHSIGLLHDLHSPIKKTFLTAVAHRCDAVCVPTRYLQRHLEENAIGTRIHVVPNPLPPECEPVAHSPPSDTQVRTSPRLQRVLIMTRMLPGKGVDLLIEALALTDDSTRLTIAGDGPRLAAYRALASRLNLQDRIDFVGWVTGAAKDRAFRDADVFCLPTMYDSFGMAFLEAMAHGIPVVALRWGGMPEVVPPNVAGLLLDERSPQALARALRSLRDDDLRRTLGEGARRWVLTQFAADATRLRLRHLIHSLC